MSIFKLNLRALRILPVFLWLLVLVVLADADVISLNGEIKFDVESNGSSEMQLNTTGLGIGTSAQANLHVNGNAVISKSLNIGTSSGSANLNLSGSLGFGISNVSSDTILDASSVVLADTSTGNLTLSLPYAGNVSGRMYHIKKIVSNQSLWVHGGGNLIDGDSALKLSEYGYLKLVSDGAKWFVLDSMNSNASTVGAANLVGWWKFDETSGNTAYDSSVSGMDGTLNAGVSFDSGGNTGPDSGSLDLDGVDDYVDLGSDAGDLIEGDAFALSFWFKINGSIISLDGLISKDQTGGPFPFSIRFTSGLALQILTNDNNLSSSFIPTQNTWYFLTYNFDTENGRNLYINGSSIVSDSYMTPVSNNANSLLVGTDYNIASTRHPPMSIDDLKIFNRTLSPTEIQVLYESGL